LELGIVQKTHKDGQIFGGGGLSNVKIPGSGEKEVPLKRKNMGTLIVHVLLM
jgi:hypothetical protein